MSQKTKHKSNLNNQNNQVLLTFLSQVPYSYNKLQQLQIHISLLQSKTLLVKIIYSKHLYSARTIIIQLQLNNYQRNNLQMNRLVPMNRMPRWNIIIISLESMLIVNFHPMSAIPLWQISTTTIILLILILLIYSGCWNSWKSYPRRCTSVISMKKNTMKITWSWAG